MLYSNNSAPGVPPVTSTPSRDTALEGDGGGGVAAIIGGVIGGGVALAVILVAVFIVVILVRRRRRSTWKPPTGGEISYPNAIYGSGIEYTRGKV